MKKRSLIVGLIALLVIIAGTWGVLDICARASAPTIAKNGTTPPNSTGQTALYLTGARVIPTVKVSTSTANCDPKQIPSVASDPANGIGSPAIKPHLCSIPTFTEQDVRQYMSTVTSFNGFRILQASPNYSITRILFVTNQTANAANGLNADTGIIDPHLIVCYVEVYGNFSVAGGPHIPAGRSTHIVRPVSHHGQLVFDGVTGNILTMGVMP
ncbi:hypothetical protein ccbrp13_39190 [Ktedonobacteria bacterium brp13]|nr:hypothetical protein ccbrp13_39190 [Ktedonobacteria bacterium brp13]